MKCPSCNRNIGSVIMQPVEGNIGMKKYKCVAYNCPLCQAVLSVEVDPLALQSGLLAKIKAALGRT